MRDAHSLRLLRFCALHRSERRNLHLRVARAAPMLARLVQTTALVAPHPPHDRSEQRLPPRARVPSAEVAMKILRTRSLPHEHRESRVAAELVEKSIDETRLLLQAELRAPQLVEIARLENAARGEIAARDRVADAEAEEVVLKAGGFADESRSV